MEGEEDFEEEVLVLLLEGKGESVDDGAEDLEELRDPVVVLRLVDEAVEDVVDLLPDVRPEAQELPIYPATTITHPASRERWSPGAPVQRGLEKVALARIFRVEQV